MHKATLAACLTLAFGTAYAGAADVEDDHASRPDFYSAARDAGLFENADENGDGVVDAQEFRDARLPCEWREWAGADEQLDASEFYERAFEAYDEAARALRARPTP